MAFGTAGEGGNPANDAADVLVRGVAAFDKAMQRTLKDGFLEKRLDNLAVKMAKIYMPIRNTTEGFLKMSGALTGLREIKETDSYLLRIGGSIIKMIPGQKELTDAVQGWMGVLQDDEGNMTKFDKFLNIMKMGGLSILTLIVSIVGGIIAVVSVVALLSLAIQGASSPFYEFYENLSGMEKLLAVLSLVAGVFYLVSGGLTGVIVGVIGLFAVATGKFDAFYSILVTVFSVVAIAIALLVMGVSAPFAIAIAVILGLIALVIRFKSTILEGLALIKDTALSIADTIGRGFKWMYDTFIAWWWEPLRDWQKKGGFKGSVIRAAQERKALGSNTTNNVTVNMNGSGSTSDGYRIGRDVGKGIQDEYKRHGGGPTRGAI